MTASVRIGGLVESPGTPARLFRPWLSNHQFPAMPYRTGHRPSIPSIDPLSV